MSGTHVVEDDDEGALIACLLPDGHQGPHVTVEAEPQSHATVVMPATMNGSTVALYLWTDGLVTWKNRRPSR